MMASLLVRSRSMTESGNSSARCGGPVSLPRLIVTGLLLLTIVISPEVSAQTLLLAASGLFAVLVIVEVLVDREARHKIRTSEHHTWAKG